MSLSGQKTTCTYLPWSDLIHLLIKLQRNKEWKFCLLIAIGCNTGLRISDILSLKWSQILGQEILEVVEKKTKKHRRIKINSELAELIKVCHRGLSEPSVNNFVFVNKYGTKPINTQWVNTKLKLLFKQFSVKTKSPSTHTLRKTFGRQAYEKNGCSEKGLLLLSEIFNHSSVATTKRYLGIQEEEIFDVYDQLNL